MKSKSPIILGIGILEEMTYILSKEQKTSKFILYIYFMERVRSDFFPEIVNAMIIHLEVQLTKQRALEVYINQFPTK